MLKAAALLGSAVLGILALAVPLNAAPLAVSPMPQVVAAASEVPAAVGTPMALALNGDQDVRVALPFACNAALASGRVVDGALRLDMVNVANAHTACPAKTAQATNTLSKDLLNALNGSRVEAADGQAIRLRTKTGGEIVVRAQAPIRVAAGD